MTTIREYAAQTPTWDHIYAIAHGYGWEELADIADPYDPDDRGRYVLESDVATRPECAHMFVAPDYIDMCQRCVDCDSPVFHRIPNR
jgi:hypothetical protein